MNCSQDKSCNVKIKAALVGDSGVGKTSILIRYTENQFVAEIGSTVGIDWRTKQIELDQKKVKLQIWDTAGQEYFSYTVPVIFRKADVILLVYDITRMQSFQNICHWMDRIPIKEETNLVLMGTKSDLTAEREVTTQMGKNMAEDLLPGGVPFFETSAKENHNIDAVFRDAVTQLLSIESKSCSCGEIKLSCKKEEKNSCCS